MASMGPDQMQVLQSLQHMAGKKQKEVRFKTILWVLLFLLFIIELKAEEGEIKSFQLLVDFIILSKSSFSTPPTSLSFSREWLLLLFLIMF